MAPIAKGAVRRSAAAAELDYPWLFEDRDRDFVSFRVHEPGFTVDDDGAPRLDRDGEKVLRISHAVWIPRAASSAD